MLYIVNNGSMPTPFSLTLDVLFEKFFDKPSVLLNVIDVPSTVALNVHAIVCACFPPSPAHATCK